MTNDYQILSVNDADAVRASTASAIKKGQEYAAKLLARINTLKHDFDLESDMIKREKEADIMTNIQSVSDNVFAALRNAANNLYGVSAFPPSVSAMNSPEKEEARHYEEIIIPSDQVLAFLEPNAIFVKTPMLWSRNNRKVRGSGGRTIGPDHTAFYRDAVQYSIKNSPNYLAYNFSVFKEKIIHYLYVYHDLPNNKIYLVDNDNHESKSVTDAIAHFLPCGDEPLSCDFYFTAAVTKSIPEGTYVTVTPKGLGMKSTKEIFSFWSEKVTNENGNL